MKRILIIDDEPNARLTFRLALEAEGYPVGEAGSGAAARERLRAEPFDLALLDLRLPDAGGLDLLEQLHEEGLATPVIIVTAYGSVPDAVRAMKLGAIDFLEKPVRPAELRGRVAEVVGGHHAAPRARPGRPPGRAEEHTSELQSPREI
jgi:DNA-binding NtrC family response regulator